MAQNGEINTSDDVEAVQQQVDIDACLDNLDIYAGAGDARSCRDIGNALARDLTAARTELADLRAEHSTAVQWMRDAQQVGLSAIAERDRLLELAEWLVQQQRVLPDPEQVDATIRDITLAGAINRAREALGRTEEET